MGTAMQARMHIHHQYLFDTQQSPLVEALLLPQLQIKQLILIPMIS